MKLRGFGLYHTGQAGWSPSFVWPANSVSVSKEKGGIRDCPIYCTKAAMTIIVKTPQFAVSE